MNRQFPPSSPIAHSNEYELQNPFYQPDKETEEGGLSPTLKLFKTKELAKERTEGSKTYPSPFPSSTVGRSSSPVRAHACNEVSSEDEAASVAKIKRKNSAIIDISLDPRTSDRLSIGRKKSVCDIYLPRGKHISRQHAFISYLGDTNRIKLECNGTNGLVVVFPIRLAHVFAKRLESPHLYELMTENQLDHDKLRAAGDKELVKTQSLTSFVLLKGETVIMPYIKDLILDFRQCEGRVRLQDVTTDEEDARNATETEDELTRIDLQTDKYHSELSSYEKEEDMVKKVTLDHVQQSPPTPQCKKGSLSSFSSGNLIKAEVDKSDEQSKITPHSSFSVKTPSAPRKVHVDTPVKHLTTPTKNKPEVISEELRRRKLNTPSPKKKTKKKSKKAGSNDQITSTQLLASLSTKGVDYKELQHVLSNHLAFSNVQQVPLFQLQDVNNTISELSRAELRAVLNDEQSIGVIYRTGKDAAGKPLDEEYYYDMENDPDEDRRGLVASLKGGRSGLRSCRRVHKQYFWKKPTK